MNKFEKIKGEEAVAFSSTVGETILSGVYQKVQVERIEMIRPQTGVLFDGFRIGKNSDDIKDVGKGQNLDEAGFLFCNSLDPKASAAEFPVFVFKEAFIVTAKHSMMEHEMARMLVDFERNRPSPDVEAQHVCHQVICMDHEVIEMFRDVCRAEMEVSGLRKELDWGGKP